MADFVFSPIPKLPFRIENEREELIKEYVLDIGSDSYFRAIVEKGVQVTKAAEGLMTGASTYDELFALIKSYIDFAFGAEGEFDFLFAKFDRNIFAMVELCRALSMKGKAAMDSKLAQNNAAYGG